MIVFLFVFGVGTANIALSLEPIIAKTVVRANIQPKRPLTASVLTANLALLCSPKDRQHLYHISNGRLSYINGTIFKYCITYAIITMLMLSVFCTFVGRKTTVTASEIAHTPEVPVKQSFTTKTKLGVVGFLLCVAGILTFGIFPNLMPSFNVDGEQVKVTMTEIVQFLCI